MGLKNPRGWFDSNSDHQVQDEGGRVRDESKRHRIAYSSFRLHPSSFVPARVAQLIERWSYKPEVEGLSPSSGTRIQFKDLSGRDSSRQNGDCLGSWSSQRRVGLHAPTRCPTCFSLSSTLKWSRFESQRQAEACRTFGPRSRHRSSKPNLQESGGKARGSTPPRASNIYGQRIKTAV